MSAKQRALNLVVQERKLNCYTSSNRIQLTDFRSEELESQKEHHRQQQQHQVMRNGSLRAPPALTFGMPETINLSPIQIAD